MQDTHTKYLDLNSEKSWRGDGILVPDVWMLCCLRNIASLWNHKCYIKTYCQMFIIISHSTTKRYSCETNLHMSIEFLLPLRCKFSLFTVIKYRLRLWAIENTKSFYRVCKTTNEIKFKIIEELRIIFRCPG